MADKAFDGKVVAVAGEWNKLENVLARRFLQEGARGALVPGSARHVQSEGGWALAEGFRKEYGDIDVWINLASIMHVGPAEAISLAQWNETLSMMLSSTFYCAQAVGRQMLARGKGVIINVTTTDAFQPIEGRAAYSTAAAGIVALTKALGIEWAGRGVRVVGLAIGPLAEQIPADSRQTYERRTPLHRIVTPDEIAEAALFLASDQASYIVGETLRVDGGWTAYQLF